jgi:hypothetical protein
MFKTNMSKCKLFSTQVFDQLMDHYVYFDSSGSIKCRFNYKNFSGGSTISNNFGSGITNMLNFISDSTEEEVWTPVIINSSSIGLMPYFEGKLNQNNIVGFENFLSFNNPKFKNMSFSGDIKIGLDWILNDPLNTEINPISGVLFWYKKNKINSSSNINNFSVGDWFFSETSDVYDKKNKRTIRAGILFVKISSEYVQALPLNVKTNSTTSLSTSMRVTPPDQNEPEIMHIDDLINCSGQCESDPPPPPIPWKIYHSVFNLKKNSNFYSIHIPDGDYLEFNYVSNGERSSYLSENLAKTYNSIYNALIDNGRYGHGNSIVKHIACILSTGPQLDKITFSNKTLPPIGDLANTIQYCQEIYRKNKVLYNEKIYNTSLIPNIIRPGDSNLLQRHSKTLNDIYRKLVNKYGLYIKFSGRNARLNINKDMVWDKNSGDGGPNISVNSEFFYWMSKNRDIKRESGLEDDENTGPGHSYYDQTIQAGPMRIKSVIKNQNLFYESTDSPNATVRVKLIKPSKNIFFNSDDNFYIMVPEIRYAMFYKQGGMKIAVSNCFVQERLGAASTANGKLDDKVFFLKDENLSSSWNPSANEATRGLTAKRYGYNRLSSADLRQPSISFDLHDSAGCIKLHNININFLRYKHVNLCNCESFYQDTILRTKGAVQVNNISVPFLGDIIGDSPPRVGYRRISSCGSWSLEGNGNHIIPSVSTQYAPPIKSYGGYDPEIIANIGVAIPDHPAPGSVMPILSERNPNYDFNLKCYARSGYLKDSNLVAGGYSQNHIMGSVVFTKGFFHPHFGWINNNNQQFSNYNGSTAVWSYKSDQKSRFVFRGTGFLFDDDSNISEKRRSYTSAIQIIMGESYSSSRDQTSYDGMRNININPNKFSHEYIVDSCIPNKVPSDATSRERLADRPCTDSGWTASSLAYNPYTKYMLYSLEDGGSTIDGNNLNNLRIKDISVKLNFLNFYSTKDMKIYLKAYFSRGGQTSPITEHAIITSVPQGLDSHDSLNQYISSLIAEHPNDTIVLLNKEFIQNYDKDFVISFSDYADMNVFLNTNDNTSDDPEFSSTFARAAIYNDTVPASYRPSSYTETSAKRMREKLNNYGASIINNKFRKWYGNYLLDSQFILHIDIDNNYNTTNYTNIIGLENKEATATSDMYKSNVVSNSLCNWQLIVDTYKDNDNNITKRSPCNINHPSTEYIDYTKPFFTDTTNPYVNSKGYNFIGDFKDKKFLIPPVNQNAPLNSLKTYNDCSYPKDAYNNFGFYKTSDASYRWLTQAILFASAGTSVGLGFAGGGFGGGLVGLSLAGAAIAASVSSIINWFAHQRQAALVDAFDDTYYDPNYDRFGYGSPDSALVEISTNNGYSWYSFDAKIFKYNKTCSPIYKPALYGYDGGTNTSSENTVSDNREFYAASEKRISPETYINYDSFVLKGNVVNKNTNFSRSKIITLDNDGNEQILTRNNNVVGIYSLVNNSLNINSSQYWNILFDSIKPFYILKNNLFGSSNHNIDLMLNNINSITNNYRSIISNISPIHIGIIPYDGKFQTLLSIPKNNISTNYFNQNTNSCIMKPTFRPLGLGIRLSEIVFAGGCSNRATLNLLNFNQSLVKDNKIADYFISAYGEGSWGTGSGSDVLHNVSHLIIPEDRTLLNYTFPFSGNSYLGSLTLNGRLIDQIDAGSISLGAFNDIDSIGIQNNILNKTLNYKNTIFYLFGNSTHINNNIVGNTGRIVFNNILHKSDPADNLIYINRYNNLTCTTDRSCNQTYECYDDNKYWISIDKDQYGTYAPLTGIKVLDSIKYGCSQAVVSGGLDCPNICGDEALNDRDIRPAPAAGRERVGVKTFRILFNFIASVQNPTIEFTNYNVDIQKSEVEALIGREVEWEKIFVDRRDIHASCQNRTADTVMRIREYYWVPKATNTANGRYIFSPFIKAETLLESSNNIRVRFKHITRKLRNMDMRYDKYILDFRGNISRGGVTRTDGMNLKNNFISWICNLTNSQTNSIVQTFVPNYYKMLNEMIFRGFFGSADGVEMKLPVSKTLNIFEWIPYEYDRNAPGCNDLFGGGRLNAVSNIFSSLSNSGLKLRCYLLSKLVSTSSEKRIIVQRCLAYMNGRTDGGIVPNKKEFDEIYATRNSSATSAARIKQLINQFLN